MDPTNQQNRGEQGIRVSLDQPEQRDWRRVLMPWGPMAGAYGLRGGGIAVL